ncbi:MAG: PQQ-binding-like beta-propeller repeat protein [bacterium]
MNVIKRIAVCLMVLCTVGYAVAQVSTRTISFSEFSFAQFTDTHLIDGDSVKTNNLKEAVEEVNNNSHIAFVVVTGDVTHNGDLASLKLAKSIFDKLKCPYFVVPGNHDTRMTEQGGTEFSKVFGNDRFRFQFNGFLFVGFDSSPVFAETNGHIAPQDIVWVKRQLKNVGKKTPVILFTHYPLKTGDVDNWYNLTDDVRKYNIQAIVGGHYHRNMVNNYDAIPGVISLATQQTEDDNIRYTIYDLSGDSILVNEKIVGVEESTQWASLPIEYKVFLEGNSREFPRPNFSVNSKYRNVVKEVWNRKIEKPIYSAPIANESNIFFGDGDGKVYSYTLDKGKMEWEYKLSARTISSPTIFENRIFFTSCDNNIYCLDTSNGELLWKKNIKLDVYSSPIIQNGVVCIKSNNEEIYNFLDINTGDVKDDYEFTNPTQNDSGLITYTTNGEITCKDISGTILWQYKIGNSGINRPLQISDSDYIVTTFDGNVVRMNLKK